MSNRDNGCQRILSWRGHGWIEPGRGVKVKTWVGWQAQVTIDALKVLPVIVGEEKCMRGKLLIRLIHAPEETEDGT